MAKLRLLLDTNIVVDYLNRREPFYEKARLLMIAGYAGEFDLWISTSQITDLLYILSDGGKRALLEDVRNDLRGLRTFVNAHPASAKEVDQMLAGAWQDPEDELLYRIALDLRADAIITRNQQDFESGLVRVMDCGEFFAWLEKEKGIAFDMTELQCI